ncbi:hypothetical protein [Rhizobium leguminosarum]|uniref:hypothetical protein n=1 Tax=Rhizobium leguminosarum TaxID=384 RepID=UPI001C96CCBD|nr:hypothetical protein [Rhizobium leguminosarum]MBY5351283.1 hypothetical protein [Rhizobium leguminosarum]
MNTRLFNRAERLSQARHAVSSLDSRGKREPQCSEPKDFPMEIIGGTMMWQCHDRNSVIKAFEKRPPWLAPFVMPKRGVTRSQPADAIM